MSRPVGRHGREYLPRRNPCPDTLAPALPYTQLNTMAL